MADSGADRVTLVLSLFPGLELLDRAFREEGFCVVAGPDRLLGGDVREFHVPAGRFDGVIGGSPCQSFSALANLVRAKGLEPKFGNLVPEFERVVVEAAPAWFLHENVPRAPIPQPAGYAVRDFTICNSSIEGEDGLGQEQERVRRFTFGVRGEDPAPNLLRWIPRAALRLPAASRTQAITGGGGDPAGLLGGSGKPKRLRVPPVCNDHVDEHRPERLRVPPLTGENGTKYETPRTRRPAVLAERSRPVDFATVAAHALNGSTAEMPDDFTTVSPTGKVMRFRKSAVLADPGSENRRERQPAITGAHTCAKRPKGGHGERRTLGEMLRLQGLPEDLLDDAPFTAKAARKMVANGVPMWLGRAVARAVKKALEG